MTAIPQSPRLTEYAQKYDRHGGSYKSGYTPLNSLFPASITPAQANAIKQVEDFQRKNLYGFTTRELAQLDAISSRELKPASLQNDIVPLLAKDRWETTPPTAFTRQNLYPLANGNGLWIMNNPEVERIMTPILVLASRILISAHMLPWLDALMDGERRPIPDYRIPEKYKNDKDIKEAVSFHARPNFDPAATAVRRDQVFERLRTKWDYTLGFASLSEDPRGPHFDDTIGTRFATTMVNLEQMEFEADTNPQWGIWTYIMYADLEHLFRTDLNAADRMSLEWMTATTIVHEVIHAMNHIVPKEGDAPFMFEPYFEDEALAEIGFGFECAVNGGTVAAFVDNDGCLPMGYWLKTEWPTFPDRAAVQEESPKLINPEPRTFQRRFPIPVSLYSDIQQEEFWAIGVRAFGQGLFFFRNMQEGAQIDFNIRPRNGPQGNSYRWIVGDPVRIGAHANYTTLTTAMNEKIEEIQKANERANEVNVLASMTPDEVRLLSFGKGLLLSSQVEGQFWTNTVAQQRDVQEIFDYIQLFQTQTTGKFAVFLSMVNLVKQIRENHEIMVATTSSLEEISGTYYTDRRRDLLAWNRGTRIFLARLKAICKDVEDQSYTTNLNEELFHLELCRLNLWFPDSIIKDVFDFQEITSLMQARNGPTTGLTMADMRNICMAIIFNEKCSSTVKCCAQILLAAMDSGQLLGWEIRCGALQSRITQLAALRWGSGRGWKDFLETWEQFARDTIQNMFSQFQGQSGMPPNPGPQAQAP